LVPRSKPKYAKGGSVVTVTPPPPPRRFGGLGAPRRGRFGSTGRWCVEKLPGV